MKRPLPILFYAALAAAAVPAAAQQVAVATPAAAPAPAPVSPKAAVRPVEAALARAAAEGRFSGTVLIARDGRPVFQHAYGMADREARIANTLETRFNLGSMNKMFTAVAIAQLAAQGKLSFQDPLSKFIPDFPTAAAAQKIRIEHLLTHTSGLGSYFNPRFFRERPTTVAAMMDVARADTALAFEPGTRQRYSNTAFLVLGAVIEKVTGQDYYDYIRDHVFVPAGMTSSSWPLRGEPGRAKEYEISPETGGQPRADEFRRGSPAGGGVSTVGDMLRFSQALLSGRLVPQEYVRLLTTPKPEVGNPRYGYGFGVIAQPMRIVGHNGGKPGVFAQLDLYPEAGYTTVLLMNQGDGEPQDEFVELLRTAVRAMAGVAAPQPAPPSAAAAGPSVALPETPAGQVAAAWLQTVRGGDTVAIRRFIAERMGGRFVTRPWDQQLAIFQRMKNGFGGGRVVSAQPTANGIRMVLATPRDRFTVDLIMDPAPPHRITGFAVEAGDDEGAGPGGPPPAGGAAPGAQAGLPDTPAGRAAAALLETMRGGDTAAIRRFVAERMDEEFQSRPWDRQLALFQRMKNDFGDGRITAVQPAENGIRVVLVGARGQFTMNLGVEPAPPHRINDFSVESGGGGAGAQPLPPLDAAAQRAVIDSVARVLERVYPSADTGRFIGERLRSRERAGAYASLTAPADFARAVTEDMRALNGDRHLNLRAGGGPRRAGRGGGPEAEEAERASNYGMESRVLEGGVGYLKLNGLSGSPQAPARLGEMLRELGDIRAMIIDLRGAPGGSGQMANAVISHFTAPDLPSLRVVNRSEGTDEVRRTLATVPGPRRTDIPVYVLVDRNSGSAAEDVPFVLQSLGRATIVGEKTAGAGRNNLLLPVGSGLVASVSISRVSDARTGREWEAIGVKPDIEVSADQALDAALQAARRAR
ncbi:MAG: serine hydrolase [Longimicrobiaceae bacterium]